MKIMTLGDVGEGSNLHLEVLGKGARLEYNVKILFTAQGSAFIKPIDYKGDVINFNRSGIMINAILTRGAEKPIQWCGCSIKIVTYKGKRYHMISCSKVGLEINRRGSYRVSVGLSGFALVDGLEKKILVVVKDVSATGFSFISDTEELTSIGADVQLVFEDAIEGEKFVLTGRLVRKHDLGNGRVQYGCKMYVPNKTMDGYIAKRQREQAAHLQKKLIQRNKDTIRQLGQPSCL